MDYTAQIFEMLGIEPNEEFKLDQTKCIYKINEHLRVLYKYETNEWTISSYELANILNGQIPIIKIPKTTEYDQIVLDYARVCGFGWLAMDRNGQIYMHKNKPTKNDYEWVACSDCLKIYYPVSFLSWEDAEPYYIGD